MGPSQAVLDGIAGRPRPLLEPLGFTFDHGDQAVSSGGPFATGFFSRGPFHIELIVRDDRLGLPNYRWDPALWTPATTTSLTRSVATTTLTSCGTSPPSRSSEGTARPRSMR
jgi:hypothetical protein